MLYLLFLFYLIRFSFVVYELQSTLQQFGTFSILYFFFRSTQFFLSALCLLVGWCLVFLFLFVFHGIMHNWRFELYVLRVPSVDQTKMGVCSFFGHGGTTVKTIITRWLESLFLIISYPVSWQFSNFTFLFFWRLNIWS